MISYVARTGMGFALFTILVAALTGCSTPGDRMSDAIVANDLAAVRRLVAAHPDAVNAMVDTNIELGWRSSVLMIAVRNQRYAIADYLIKHGARIEVKDTDRLMPLQAAVYNGDPKMTLILLRAGASPYTHDAEGWSVLHHAADRGNKVLVNLLLSFGADPSKEDKSGKKPADYALKNGYKEIATILKTHSAAQGKPATTRAQ